MKFLKKQKSHEQCEPTSFEYYMKVEGKIKLIFGKCGLNQSQILYL